MAEEPRADNLDDDAAFAQAMQDVVPLSEQGGVTRTDQRTPREVTQSHINRREAAQGDTPNVDPNFLTEAEVPQKQPLEYLEWRKDGVQLAVFDKLRHAGYDIEGHLDLHRKTVKEARTMVFNFVRMAQANGWRCLLISPGKGELSPTPARLKSYLDAWLRAHPEVIAFCSAQRQHGGVGAVYALLRKSKESSENNRERFS
ncbi:MAG: DNA endonuclease SmrA [Pseudomonadota bacterium]